MALNPNHVFEDLGEVKCAIAEKNCTPERVDFLKRLLENNGFTVIIAKSPPPKGAKPTPPKPVAITEGAIPVDPLPPEEHAPPPPDTFTVGVTDLTFSPINAVFNRELKTFDGAIVSSAYWKQKETNANSGKWYWEKER
jgi:hypothetical protein